MGAEPDFDVEAAIRSMSLEEKAALTAGEDLFSTVAVERLGIPKIRMTDGPSGARGDGPPGAGGAPSTCIPSGSAIGASWDVDLAGQLGSLVGREARDRGCRGLLAPTVNLHRSPLAGRNFECYSEDPFLSGKLAASYIRGVQRQGVFATVKHLVGNDSEFERYTMDSVIDDRALRELYLLPFELAVREGGVHAVMTAYNRLNGRWLTEQKAVLVDILRHEWGFEGLVMSDWFAVVDPQASLAAGLDLEMPGPGRSLGARVAESVRAGQVAEHDLDEAVRRLLVGLGRAGVLSSPTPPVAPAPPSPVDVDLLRRAASDCCVLLRNSGVLPLAVEGTRRIAVIGALAARPTLVGGGSAAVRPHRRPDVVEALAAAVGAGVEVIHERGCEIDRSAPLLGRGAVRAPSGFAVEVFAGEELTGPAVHTETVDELRVFAFGGLTPGYPAGAWSARVSGTIVAGEDGRFELALAQSGQARVFLDGQLILDGVGHPPPPGGSDFFGRASLELTGRVDLARRRPYPVAVEFSSGRSRVAGFRVGWRSADPDGLLERAVAAAGGSDVAVVVVGHSEEWETEGQNRPSFHLPGRQNELVRRVAAANPRTVVVVNTGSAVDLPWAGEVGALLQGWFAGQEMDRALAEILLGRAEPGGRLPFSVPQRIEHCPAHDNFPGENGQIRYGEGIFAGYRGYLHRRIAPRFPFGHGLGYTTFEWGEPAVAPGAFVPGQSLTVSVRLTNTGSRPGAEVVQCYVAPPAAGRLARPPCELKGFAKVRLAPGESTTVELALDDRSFAYWDPGQADFEQVQSRLSSSFLLGHDPAVRRRPPGWQVDPGRYEVLLGRSVDDIRGRVAIDVVEPSE
jgi:beta-glucosidase